MSRFSTFRAANFDAFAALVGYEIDVYTGTLGRLDGPSFCTLPPYGIGKMAGGGGFEAWGFGRHLVVGRLLERVQRAPTA